MKTYKNIVSALMVVFLLIGSITAMPLSVGAVGGNGMLIEEGDYRAIYYRDDRVRLIEANVNEENVMVPSSIGGYTVTEISNAYENNNKIKSVTIPDTITGILGRAFSECKNLESINIPDSVTNIGGSAFSGCVSLKSINIPDKVTTIDNEAFFMCNALKEITIPESVSYIGENAFADCKSLATVNISENQDLEIEGSAFNYSKWYNNQPDGVVYLDRYVLKYKGTMPENLEVNFKKGTTAICSGAFSELEFESDVTALVNVTLPDTLKFIGTYAFYKCVNLQSVDFPDSLNYIGSNAFAYCSSLKSAIIPAGVSNISHAFSQSGVESVTLKGNPEMWYNAFGYCENLKEVKLSDTLENINQCAFDGCKNLESITLPDSVKEIEWAAFKNCEKLSDIKHSGNIYKINSESFKNTAWHNTQPDGFVYFGNVLMGYKGKGSATIDEIIIKDGVIGVAAGAFENYSNVNKIIFPEGLKAIGAYSFRETAVESIEVPESVEFIGYSAFASCPNLNYLNLKGSGIIGNEAFINCLNLKSVTVSADIETIEKGALGQHYNAEGLSLVEGFVINGFKGSSAEAYAKENGIDFKVLSIEDNNILGDVNFDGKVNVKDATMIQKAVAKIITLTDIESICSDVNADKKVNVKDATAIQKYVAKIETGLPIGEKI